MAPRFVSLSLSLALSQLPSFPLCRDELISQLKIEKSELEERVSKEVQAHQATETFYQEKCADLAEELQVRAALSLSLFLFDDL